VANAVRALMATRTGWTGTASDLLGALTELIGEAERKSRSWPNAPSKLSGRLRRAATFLRKAGIEIGFDRETNHQRSRSICITWLRESGGDFASAPSASSAPDNTPLGNNGLLEHKLRTVDDAADDWFVRSGRTDPLKSTGSDGADDTDANNTAHSGANSTPGTTVIDL